MQVHRTTRCSESGHPEVTLQLPDTVPIPGLYKILIEYFEASVARGVKFLPGQTVQFGWSVLRMIERGDGTLGVQERERTPEMSWTELLGRSLDEFWMQKEIVDSVGLLDAVAFPHQDEIALVARCAMEAKTLVMTRVPDDELPEGFSGWMFACTEDHDHGDRVQLPLLGVAAMQPGVVQLLALPHGTSVLVVYRQKADAPEGMLRIEPHVFRGSQEITPAPDSYLAALQR